MCACCVALSVQACEKIGAYLGPECSLGDCFVVVRSVFVLEEVGVRGNGAYSRLDLTKTTRLLEQLVERVLAARQARTKRK